MKIKSIVILLACLLLLSGLTVPAIACDCEGDPPAECYRCEAGVWVQYGNCWEGCDDCYSCENCYCDWDCTTGQCCDNDDCVDNCPSGECCDDGTCVSSCPTGECCDDGTCVDDCPSGECCDDGTCVSSCPSGECCDDGTCVSSCPSGECCDDGTCVSSCPSGECCDDGECVDTCPNCYECVDGDCVPCKCWDAGTAISGSITVQNAKLCEQKTHTSSISDTDHWFLGGDGHGYPADSLTYSWTASAGTPATSTTANFTWTAPPCTGPVTISLTANDVPDSMDNPCPGSTRDDDPNNFNDVSTISLPTGCSNAGPHDSSVHWTNPGDDYWSTTVPPFGDFTAYEAIADIDFRYDSCSWKCEISDVEAVTQIRVRDPFSLPDKVDVTIASEVPCDDAELAKYDLYDYDLADDEGAPYRTYWCYLGAVAHEEKHRSDWEGFYDARLTNAIDWCELLCRDIYCPDANTHTCEGAWTFWQSSIEEAFWDAWDCTLADYDDPGTPLLDEADVRAYFANWIYDIAISDALPEGCTP